VKKIYFVTATNTDVGKTYSCEIILKSFANSGKKVGYFKPFETGVDTVPADGNKLLNITKKLNPGFDFTLSSIVPFMFKLPAAPFVAALDENKSIDLKIVFDTIGRLLQKCDVLVIEGAGGLCVPLLKDYFIIDLIKQIQQKYDTKTFLISPSSLGSINDTLLSQNLLDQYCIEYKWYINLYKDKEAFEKVTLPFYKHYFDSKTIGFIQGFSAEQT
jgi:dethiobiotin synthetase